jgi:hypothetical protein
MTPPVVNYILRADGFIFHPSEEGVWNVTGDRPAWAKAAAALTLASVLKTDAAIHPLFLHEEKASWGYSPSTCLPFSSHMGCLSFSGSSVTLTSTPCTGAGLSWPMQVIWRNTVHYCPRGTAPRLGTGLPFISTPAIRRYNKISFFFN